VTVLLHDQGCAAENRPPAASRGKIADPPQRIHINERVCEGLRATAGREVLVP